MSAQEWREVAWVAFVIIAALACLVVVLDELARRRGIK